LKKMIFITPAGAEYGFRLAGISHYTSGRDDTESLLNTMTEGPDTGIIIIDERLLEYLPENMVKEIEKRWDGILLVLPAPERPGIGIEDYAAKLIREAIGYHMRLRT